MFYYVCSQDVRKAAPILNSLRMSFLSWLLSLSSPLGFFLFSDLKADPQLISILKFFLFVVSFFFY